MCGISGFSLKEKFENKENILKLMNDKLIHRGPDGEGFYHDNDVSLSHKRLAIIDLNPRSNQPFTDKNKEYIITFNGEIYNFVELREILKSKGFIFTTTSDTEVLLNSYICWGTKLFDKIKGMFSFAIYDKKRKKILCGRDHFGQKPFFYYIKDGNFIFSSELTSLISHPKVKKEICIKSIIKYLHYDSFVGKTSPIKNCYKLLPSEYLLYDINSRDFIIKNYYKINIHDKKILPNDYYDQFVEKLTNSTKLHLRSDVPIALYLSGGIDSSTLACVSKKLLQSSNITAFNLKFKHETFNENKFAKDTAHKLNLKLVSYNLEDTDFISNLKNSIDKIDEPLADLGFLAISFISKFVSSDNYKVVISGDGGDELLMGYEPFQKFWLYNLLNKMHLLSKSIKYVSSIVPDSFGYMGNTYKMKVFSKALNFPITQSNSRWICSFQQEEIDKLGEETGQNSTFRSENKQIFNYINKIIDSIDSKDRYDQLSIQYQKHFLSDLICNHTDKANMQYSIEARSPFLDPDLFNFTNSLPKQTKINYRFSKVILRKFLKKNLNNSTYKNKKKGFTVPMALWINNELKNLILDTLSQDTIMKTGFLNYNFLYNEVIKPHLDKKSNNHKKIWNVFVLVNWLKKNQLI
tara:strand:+ start:5995 stop:7899 length:1905 start_codon:yes stop_codon:yes gene_type:complete